MPTTPRVPTPLAAVEVHPAPRRSVPSAVLVGQFGMDGQPGPPRLGPGADALGHPPDWLIEHGPAGSAGEVQAVPGARGRPAYGWLVGVGQGTARDWRAAGAALVRSVAGRTVPDPMSNHTADLTRPNGHAPSTVQIAIPDGTDAERVEAFVVGCMAASHDYRVTAEPSRGRLRTVRLVAPPEAAPALTDAVRRAGLLGAATGLARDLAATPSNRKDPAWLAETGARLAEPVRGLQATLRDERWLREHGFGGMLAVGGGSARPPRLLELRWRPRAASPDAWHPVLVGKGITFDTGGLSIKPAEDMHLMRTDMSGGAAVIAAMLAIARLGVPLPVTGLVPCAENLLSGSAYRPGDVIRHVGGRTTEVSNTDAEGRLVLADALAYAVRTLRPTALVDVATLTGAMKVALGLRTGGFFATDEQLADRLHAAGERAGEAWWRLPLLAEHADAVRSEIADLQQCPPGPAAITAALFLREFTEGVPWVHMDIAGPARASTVYDEVNPGGTGFATRTLVELVRSYTG